MAIPLTLLFWNLKGNEPLADARRERLLSALCDLTQFHSLDVLLLAECPFRDERIDLLSTVAQKQVSRISDDEDKVQIFARSNSARWQRALIEHSNRICIFRLTLGSRPMLLGAIHFDSKFFVQSATSRYRKMLKVVQSIRETEREQGIDRTLLIGDFNLNPYEEAMVDAEALNARMTRYLAGASRKPAFYNPTWGFFGDRSPGPPGTYHYSSSESSNHNWHVFDQVLLRPGFVHCLELVEILSETGKQSLVTPRAGRPNAAFSDHLPLLVRLHLEGEVQ